MTLELEPAADGLAFTVIDRGPGIAIEERERIFERFHQTDAAATRSSEGAGLGLYITKQLVEAMGGKVELTSEIGVASAFRISLPVAPGDPTPAQLSAASRAD